jgi:uncharacterized membrane protein YhiD involved in acid resistance
MLVAMGAALFVLIPQQAGIVPADLSRVIQGVVAGIGFLCAGSILKSEDEDRVRGLTTAAGMWLTAAIGMAAGLGREATAVISTVLALVILSLVPVVVKAIEKPEPRTILSVDTQKMTRILILGGTGFVGRHVCEKLARLQSPVTVATRRTGHARDLITLPLLHRWNATCTTRPR